MCNCEDRPCCGCDDEEDPTSRYYGMTDDDIKQAVYDRMARDDYDPDYDED